MSQHTIIVGNIGTVHTCTNPIEAGIVYADYKGQSAAGYSRAAGESVTWFKDDEPHKEYIGTIEQQEVQS